MSGRIADVYVTSDQEWEKYKIDFGKMYSAVEENSRRQEWEKNIRMVNSHNDNYRKGIVSFSMGVNQFSDGTMPAMGLLRP